MEYCLRKLPSSEPRCLWLGVLNIDSFFLDTTRKRASIGQILLTRIGKIHKPTNSHVLILPFQPCFLDYAVVVRSQSQSRDTSPKCNSMHSLIGLPENPSVTVPHSVNTTQRARQPTFYLEGSNHSPRRTVRFLLTTSELILSDLATLHCRPTSNMGNLRGRITTIVATTAIALFSGRVVQAHEHHAEDIPEGQYMSADPIVGGCLSTV
jgi:hypothetical protein